MKSHSEGGATTDRVTSTGFFRCDRCQVECRVDSEGPEAAGPYAAHDPTLPG
jgi:hypothetical protein